MKRLLIPYGVTEIKPFEYCCTDTDEIIMPPTVKSIGEFAFIFSKVKMIYTSPYLETIDNGAFAQSDIKHIILPSELRYLSPSAFDGCTGVNVYRYIRSMCPVMDWWLEEPSVIPVIIDDYENKLAIFPVPF